MGSALAGGVGLDGGAHVLRQAGHTVERSKAEDGQTVYQIAAPLPAEPASIQEASLRLAMAMQFQRIERFRSQSGRLPTTIEEVGPAMPGVRYQARHPDGFTLTGTNGSVTLTLQSTESLSAFVGNSYELIQGRAAP